MLRSDLWRGQSMIDSVQILFFLSRYAFTALCVCLIVNQMIKI